MFPMGTSKRHQRGGTTYRSRRAVPRTRDAHSHFMTDWTTTKVLLVCVGTALLALTTLVPMLLLDTAKTASSSPQRASVSLHGLVQKSIEVENEYKQKGKQLLGQAELTIEHSLHMEKSNEEASEYRETLESTVSNKVEDEGRAEPAERANLRHENKARIPSDSEAGKPRLVEETEPPTPSPVAPTKNGSQDETEEPTPAPVTPTRNGSNEGTESRMSSPLARGVSGLPMSETPALVGASRGHVVCDVNVDDIVYWNDPQGDRDRDYVTPFATAADSYLTFEPDPGGWNNIRMSMEIIFVLAAATGRTLVLPPKSPFYLLGMGKEGARSFGSFFSLDRPEFQKKVKVISMSEFLEREKNGLLNLSNETYNSLKPVAELCLHQPDSPINCNVLYEHLRNVGLQPEMEGMKQCLVFDLDYFNGKEVTDDVKNRTARFCTEERQPVYYDSQLHTPRLIHWNAGIHKYRLLNHFYGFMYFTDPKIDNFYKRFVRDFLHYNDKIYCAAVSSKKGLLFPMTSFVDSLLMSVLLFYDV